MMWSGSGSAAGCQRRRSSIDLWSVGLIFAELLNGQVLFQARSEPDQLPLVLENFLYCHASHTISSRAMFEKTLALQYEGLSVLASARPFGGIGLVYRKPFLVAQTKRAAAAKRGGGTGGAANGGGAVAAPTRGGQTAEISLDLFMKRRRIDETVAGTAKAPAAGGPERSGSTARRGFSQEHISSRPANAAGGFWVRRCGCRKTGKIGVYCSAGFFARTHFFSSC